MATLRIKGDVIALDRKDGMYGVETRDKDGNPTGLRYIPGVKLLPIPQAVSVMKAGGQVGDNMYQACASFIAHNVGAILAGIDVDTLGPKEAAKQVSEKIANLATN